jgi:hypothetical protein
MWGGVFRPRLRPGLKTRPYNPGERRREARNRSELWD